jgi:hypothetical protein
MASLTTEDGATEAAQVAAAGWLTPLSQWVGLDGAGLDGLGQQGCAQLCA